MVRPGNKGRTILSDYSITVKAEKQNAVVAKMGKSIVGGTSKAHSNQPS